MGESEGGLGVTLHKNFTWDETSCCRIGLTSSGSAAFPGSFGIRWGGWAGPGPSSQGQGPQPGGSLTPPPRADPAPAAVRPSLSVSWNETDGEFRLID